MIIKRPLTRFDLIEEADFIEQVYGLEKANTFLDAAQETFDGKPTPTPCR